MHFDWTINITTLVSVVGILFAIVAGIYRFQSWINVSQLKADHTIDLITLRVHQIEEWMKTHTVDANAREITSNDLRAAVAKLTIMADMSERRLQRIEDKADAVKG
jgi:hypothetical protein